MTDKMRGIKFRVWDKENKKWFEDWYCLYPKGQVGVLNDEADVIIATRLIPIFWTGLKDKQGKEIYEGDILDHNEVSNKVVVIFVDGCFVDRSSLIPLRDLYGFEHWEVVGNKFENPKMIGGQ